MKVWFGLVSLINGISNLHGLFNVKAILLEGQFIPFSKGINQKVNVIKQLEYKLTHNLTQRPLRQRDSLILNYD